MTKEHHGTIMDKTTDLWWHENDLCSEKTYRYGTARSYGRVGRLADEYEWILKALKSPTAGLHHWHFHSV